MSLLGKTPTALLFPYSLIVGRTRCTITVVGMVQTPIPRIVSRPPAQQLRRQQQEQQ